MIATIEKIEPASDKQPKSRRVTTAPPSDLETLSGPGSTGSGVAVDAAPKPATTSLSERSRRQRSLRNSELRYRRLFETAQDGILILDAETGAITDVNPYLIAMLGYSREEFVEKKLWQVGAFRDTEAGKDEFAELQRNEYVRYDDLPLKAKNGRLIQVEFVSNVYLVGDERVIQCNIRDITARKEVVEALQNSREESFRLLNSMAEGAYGSDTKGNCTFVNRAFLQMLGYQDDHEVLGKHIHELIHHSHSDGSLYPSSECRMYRAHQANQPIHVADEVFWRKDGVAIPVEYWSHPIVRDGEVIGSVATFTDITERQRAEEELRQSEERYRRLVELLPDGVIVHSEGRLVFANPASARIVGASDSAGLTSKPVIEFVHPEYRQLALQRIGKAQRDASPAPWTEEKFIKVDGTPIDVEVSAVPFSYAGKPAMLTVFNDITARKQADALQNAVYQIAQASELVSSLSDLFPQIQRIISEVMPAENFYIALYDHARNRLSFPYSIDEVDRTYSGEEIEPGRGLTAYVLRTAKSLLCTEAIHERLVQHGEIEQIGVLSRIWLGVPLIVRSEVIGVMVVQHYSNPHAYGEREQRVLEFVSSQVAMAIDRKQAEQQMRQRLSEMEAVHTVSTTLRNAQTRKEALPILLDETLAALETDTGAIWLYHAESGELRVAVTRGWFRQFDEMPMRPGEGIVGRVFATGKAHVTTEFTRDPLVRQPATGEIPAGWGGITLPIRAGAVSIGVLMVSVPLPRQITSEQVQLLELLADMAGATLRRMDLHDHTVRQLEFLEALHSIDIAISASMDLQLTLNILLQHVKTQLNADATDVLLLNSHSQTLEYAAGRGFRTRGVQTARMRLGVSFAGRAALGRRAVQADDLPQTGEDPRFAALWTGEGFAAYYGVPLIAKGEVKGVLEVFHRAPFHPEPDWISFLESLAGQAAIAIDSAQLFENLQHSTADLERAYDATIEGWSRALDLRDRETEGHTQRVTEIAMRLAIAMGIGDAQLVHVRRGALLHDIGKMGVPDSILLKPGPLTDAEWVVMRKHPQLAYDLLSPVAYLRAALDIPYCHHERWDGTGYPRRLKGEQIPLMARIFAVVDVWDALRSDRPYRPAWQEDKVLEHICSRAGTHFDPEVVRVCLASGVLETQARD